MSSTLATPANAAAPLAPPLARKLLAALVGVLLLTGALLAATWVWIARGALQHEHEAASLRMAALFEAGLQRAMLQRDLDGLQRMLGTVGQLPGLSAAALINPQGEVRFASQPARLGQHEGAAVAGMCLHRGCGEPAGPRLQWHQADPAAQGMAASLGPAEQRLRVAWPVRNQAACAGCHGLPSAHPVNGVLLLDFAPMAGERQARIQSVSRLLPLALAALALAGLALAWVLRREVLAPVARLAAAMQRFGGGDLAARAQAPATVPTAAPARELVQLAQGFDRMAERVGQQVAALDGQHRFLQQLIDATPDAMLLIDADHRVVLANAAYARLVGREQAQVVGRRCHEVSRARAEPCPVTLVNCPLAECRGSGKPMRTVMAFTRADGSTVDVEIEAAPLPGLDGRTQVIEMIRPLEDHVRFSQEQRLSAVGLLASGVAHEIHNPLASIRLALQSSRRALADGRIDAQELAADLELVDEQIDRCVAITRRLMRLSEASAEHPGPVNLAEAVEDVTALLAEDARRAGVIIEVQAPAQPLYALADDGEVRQVVFNLAHNALHAMPHGGVMTLEMTQAGMEVELAVADNGVGIAAERLALIFLPFYSRRADGRRGTGMGLAICKGLVEQRGGRITARSQPGVGSRFSVHWPAAEAMPGVQAGEAA